MRLAAKLMLVFLAVVMLMTAAGSYFSVRRGFQRFERRQRQLARDAAAAVDNQLAEAWRRGGAEGVLEAMSQLQLPASQSRIRWVWLEQSQTTSGGSQTSVVERFQIDGEGAQLITRTITDAEGRRHLQVIQPIDLGDSPRGGLQVTGSLAALDAEARETIIISLITLGAMAAVSLGLVYFAGVRWVTRPLDRLIDKTRRIAEGDFDDPLPVRGRDELSQLASALNHMSRQLAAQQQRIADETAARLATLEQLRHADRLKTVGRLAAGLAHELGTPLNVVSGRAGLIASGRLSSGEVTSSAEAIKAEAERVTSIIRQLLDFARPAARQRSEVNLGQLLRQTADLLEPLADKRNVRIRVSQEEDCGATTVSADRGQLQQVLTNILVNAVQAMPDGGEVDAGLACREARPPAGSEPLRRCAAVSVRDQGAGIPADELDQIFEPFFTTKDVGEGTGLGLAIAYGIVQEHGGWIEVDSQPQRGSCFTVYLPRE